MITLAVFLIALCLSNAWLLFTRHHLAQEVKGQRLLLLVRLHDAHIDAVYTDDKEAFQRRWRKEWDDT